VAWYVQGLHRVPGGHAVERGSVMPAVRSRDEQGTLWLGQGVVVQGGVRHDGGVVLAKKCVTWAGIVAGHEVVVGAHTVVRGDVHAEGRVVVQHGATVHGDVRAGADVLLLGDCVVGDVHAGGDIIVVGAPKTGRLVPAGRVQTRSW
jgi:cytoskeletal protein CcmA (bactofilin family)